MSNRKQDPIIVLAQTIVSANEILETLCDAQIEMERQVKNTRQILSKAEADLEKQVSKIREQQETIQKAADTLGEILSERRKIMTSEELNSGLSDFDSRTEPEVRSTTTPIPDFSTVLEAVLTGSQYSFPGQRARKDDEPFIFDEDIPF